MNLFKTKAFIEQHIHGAYGVDFLNCDEDALLFVSEKLFENGVTIFLPTLATAPIEILKKQIAIIKNVMKIQLQQKNKMAKIFGVNLEACFIASEKSGIHDRTQLLAPTIENYSLIEDEIIKIVTIAPELDKNNVLTNYLSSKAVKVFAGHTQASDLSSVDGVTHLFNAMNGLHHREKTTALSALSDDNIYCEIILDGHHVNYELAKIVLKAKQRDKIILISDALPLAKSNLDKIEFCSKIIFNNGGIAQDENGVFAGSTLLLSDIVKKLVQNNITNLEQACEMASNSSRLFDIEYNDCIVWDDKLNIVDVIS